MTPDEIERQARLIVLNYYRDSQQIQEIVDLVRAAERAAIEQERERCARIAEAAIPQVQYNSEIDLCSKIAAAIRSLIDTTPRTDPTNGTPHT